MSFSKYHLTVVWPGYAFYNYHFFDELNKLSEKGYAINVIFIRGIREDSEFYNEHQLHENLNVVKCNFKGIRVKDYSILKNIKLFLLLFKYIVLSKKVLTSTQAPLHSKYAFVITKLLLKNIAVIVEQWEDYKPSSSVMSYYKKLGYFLIKKADTVFVHGQSQREFVTNHIGRKKRKTVVLPFLSRRPKSLESESVNNNGIIILYFGRIIEQKGLDVLIEAFNQIETTKKAKLVICGGIDDNFFWNKSEAITYYERCKQLALYNENIVFTGQVDPKQKDDYFKKADVFVHPHKLFNNKNDGWGLVINEALSHGLPIITTPRVGSTSTLVHNQKNGFIVEPSNADALKEKISILIEDDTLRNKFSKAAKEMFEAYHKPEVINEHLETYIVAK